MGVPIDPEKIREMLALSSRDEQAETVPEQPGGGEDIEEYLSQRGLRSDRGESPDARTEGSARRHIECYCSEVDATR
jgi:hypothetical protein